MTIQKYRLRYPYEHLQVGAVVYDLTKHDYGLARDDTNHTGVPHVSVTMKEDGDYPSFTIPTHLLVPEN